MDFSRIWISERGAEQEGGCVPAHRVSSCHDPGPIASSLQRGDKSLNVIHVIEDELHVFHPRMPEDWCSGAGCWEGERLGCEVSWLDYHEAVGSPEVCKWCEAIEGRQVVGKATAVGEEDDG